MIERLAILDQYPDYEVVIGIEVHVQLATDTKLFCSCPLVLQAEPNSAICPVCAGHPGTLPLLNQNAIEYAVQMGLATHCSINDGCFFARKHYFYPDLPKGYQITQSSLPICSNGFLDIITGDENTKRIRIMRIHMEEDAGKNIHSAITQESYVDLNRAGTPLLEVVSEPDLSSVDEVKAYLKELRNIVMFLGIGTGNMEDGAFRADTNISVRKRGAPLGTRVELKNINSFKFIGDAVEYEITRQITELETGNAIIQQTRLWETNKQITIPMRSKEEAADYRYMLEPDLPCLSLSDQYIAHCREAMRELPAAARTRYANYGLNNYEIDILINDRDLAHYFEKTYAICPSPLVINWILREVQSTAKDLKVTPNQLKVTPNRLGNLLELIENKKINNNAAAKIFEIMLISTDSAEDIMKKEGLEQINSIADIEAIAVDIIAQNPNQVAAYRSGKTKLFGFFVGQMMQKTKGAADPLLVNDIFNKLLS